MSRGEHAMSESEDPDAPQDDRTSLITLALEVVRGRLSESEFLERVRSAARKKNPPTL